MDKLEVGMKVVFIEDFQYEGHCNCCGSETSEYIEKGTIQAIRSIDSHSIGFYETSIDLTDANIYIKPKEE
jgi:hypothetical protein